MSDSGKKTAKESSDEDDSGGESDSSGDSSSSDFLVLPKASSVADPFKVAVTSSVADDSTVFSLAANSRASGKRSRSKKFNAKTPPKKIRAKSDYAM